MTLLLQDTEFVLTKHGIHKLLRCTLFQHFTHRDVILRL